MVTELGYDSDHPGGTARLINAGMKNGKWTSWVHGY